MKSSQIMAAVPMCMTAVAPRRDPRNTGSRAQPYVAEFHNTHCVCRPALIGDCVFGDPEIAFSENSSDVKTRRLAWMMTPQCLQIASPEDSFA
jgi:hypothetical protein